MANQNVWQGHNTFFTPKINRPGISSDDLENDVIKPVGELSEKTQRVDAVRSTPATKAGCREMKALMEKINQIRQSVFTHSETLSKDNLAAQKREDTIKNDDSLSAKLINSK